MAVLYIYDTVGTAGLRSNAMQLGTVYSWIQPNAELLETLNLKSAPHFCGRYQTCVMMQDCWLLLIATPQMTYQITTLIVTTVTITPFSLIFPPNPHFPQFIPIIVFQP